MDNCCLNRPSDDQSKPRIHLESEAIKTIIDLVEKEIWELLSSDVLVYEISNTADEKRRINLLGINKMAIKTIRLTSIIKGLSVKIKNPLQWLEEVL